MKKQYKKPEIYIEEFILSDYIAACGTIITFSGGENSMCEVRGDFIDQFWKDLPIFDNSGKCEISTTGPEYAGTICYHSGTASYQVFTS